MAWKFKQEYVRDGDILEPSELRINVNEFASEFDGFLDSDNFQAGSIQPELVKRGTFTDVIGPTTSSMRDGIYQLLFNHTTSGWQDEAIPIGRTDLNADSWHYDTFSSFTYSSSPDEFEETDIIRTEKLQLPRVKFKSDSDGLAIIEFCGFVAWSRFHLNSDFPFKRQKEDLPDTHIIEGTLDAPYNYSYYGPQTKYFKLKSSFVLCSQWRLTFNGVSVAETGPLGNEYWNHPIYLTGTAPVQKSKDNVAKIEARFFWYSPGTGESIDASGWSPFREESQKKNTWRRDCSLMGPNMVVIYRKR